MIDLFRSCIRAWRYHCWKTDSRSHTVDKPWDRKALASGLAPFPIMQAEFSGQWCDVHRRINIIQTDQIRLQEGDFPGGPVAKTLRSHCRGPRFHPWSGNEIPHTAAKTQCSQINEKIQELWSGAWKGVAWKFGDKQVWIRGLWLDVWKWVQNVKIFVSLYPSESMGYRRCHLASWHEQDPCHWPFRNWALEWSSHGSRDIDWFEKWLLHGKSMGKQWKQCQTLFFLALNHCRWWLQPWN